jgi:hypothetical protein
VAQGRRHGAQRRAALEEAGSDTAAEALGADPVSVATSLLKDGFGDGHELALAHLFAEVGRGAERLVLPRAEEW